MQEGCHIISEFLAFWVKFSCACSDTFIGQCNCGFDEIACRKNDDDCKLCEWFITLITFMRLLTLLHITFIFIQCSILQLHNIKIITDDEHNKHQ